MSDSTYESKKQTPKVVGVASSCFLRYDENEHFAVEICTVLEPFGVYLRIDEEATPTIFRICLLDS